MVIKKLLNNLSAQKEADRKARLYRNLIRHEGRIGGRLFGPIPEGVRREFFCLDEHTWVWHEEWTNADGQRQTKTTRYDVRPNGVLKVQDGRYQTISAAETRNLKEATRLYEERIRAELYNAIA